MEEYSNKPNVTLRNITSVATDFASMVGRCRRFSVFLKEKVLTVHTVHRQHIVDIKLSGELHEAMKVCIKSINEVKAHLHNSRLFSNSYEKNNETFSQLIFYTVAMWLSRCNSLQRLDDLYDSSEESLMNEDPSLCDQIEQCKNHVLYLADLHSKFNQVQKRLQGTSVTIIQA